MATLLCPICGEMRTMRVSSATRQTLAGSGVQNVKIREYHCEVCNSFVKRVDLE